MADAEPSRTLVNELEARTDLPEIGAQPGDVVLEYSDGAVYVVRRCRTTRLALALAVSMGQLVIPRAGDGPAAPPPSRPGRRHLHLVED